MSLYRIVMRLARNPGTEYADGDDHRGYSLVAPLNPEGHIDEDGFRQHKDDCVVRHFQPDADPINGRLSRRGEHWFFDYDHGQTADDEGIFKLGAHRFAVGEYVTINDEEGRPLTYKVTDLVAA